MRSLMFLGMCAVCAVVAGITAVVLLVDSASNPLNYYRGLACLGVVLMAVSLPYFAWDEWSWADTKKPFVAAWEVIRFTWHGSPGWQRALLVVFFVPGGAVLVLCPPLLQRARDRMVRGWMWGEMVRAAIMEKRRHRLGQPPGSA